MPLLLVVPTQYPLIMMGLAANYFLLTLIPLLVAPVKKRVFTEEHLTKYEEGHKAVFGAESKIDKLALPDQGTGWYSKDLPYKDWIDIQQAMRVPMNFIEHLPVLVFFSMVAGLYFPLVTLIVVWVYFLARVIFTIGYMKQARLRLPGSLLSIFSAKTLCVLALISAIIFLQGIESEEVSV